VVGRALTSRPGASAVEGEDALTEYAQRQRTWALTGGPGHQGVRAQSGILGSGPFDQVRRGPRGSEPFDQDRMGEIRPRK
jgi:hypothetical protein